MLRGMSTATSLAQLGIQAQAIAHWRDRGWVAVPGFFTAPEVAALQAAVRSLQNEGKLRNVATIGDGATHDAKHRNLQLCPCGPHHRLLRALPWHPRVVAAITGLLGDDVVQELDQIFLKPAGDGVGTGWHTDNAYFRCDDKASGTGMWIAIHDANEANGCMRIIDRSHQREWRHVRDPGSDHHITCAAEIADREATLIELSAGGVLFFNYGIAHATGPNRTDRDRAGLAYHFRQRVAVGDLDRGGANFLQQGGLMALAGPSCDGGRQRYGEDLRGVFAQECGAAAVP
jgi:phytanoyl-CoA hydroxylase